MCYMWSDGVREETRLGADIIGADIGKTCVYKKKMDLIEDCLRHWVECQPICTTHLFGGKVMDIVSPSVFVTKVHHERSTLIGILTFLTKKPLNEYYIIHFGTIDASHRSEPLLFYKSIPFYINILGCVRLRMQNVAHGKRQVTLFRFFVRIHYSRKILFISALIYTKLLPFYTDDSATGHDSNPTPTYPVIDTKRVQT